MMVGDHRAITRRRLLRRLAPLAACLAWTATPSLGEVSVTLDPVTPTAIVGETVEVQIILSSSTPATMAAAQVLFAWDPAEMRLQGVSNDGGPPLLASGLPRPDPHGLNEAGPPADGDALYLAFAQLGSPLGISQEGESVLLATLLFEALTPTDHAEIDLLPSAGSPLGHTIVLDGDQANHDITGTLTGTSVVVVPAPGVGFALACAGVMAATRRTRRND